MVLYFHLGALITAHIICLLQRLAFLLVWNSFLSELVEHAQGILFFYSHIHCAQGQYSE